MDFNQWDSMKLVYPKDVVDNAQRFLDMNKDNIENIFKYIKHLEERLNRIEISLDKNNIKY